MAGKPHLMRLYALITRPRLARGHVELRMRRAWTLLGVYLQMGRWSRARALEKRLLGDEALRDLYRFRIGDFRPSGLAIGNDWFRVLADERVEELAAYLLEGTGELTDWLAGNLGESPGRITFFMYPGVGPSPFNASLRHVYLMAGHYRAREHDRTVVRGALAHEIAHIHLRRVLGFSFSKEDYGRAKLFDEGWAQMCGWRAARAWPEKLAEAHALSREAIAVCPGLLQSSLDAWSETLFERPWVPLYPMAMSFTAWVGDRSGEEALREVFAAPVREGMDHRVRDCLGEGLADLLEGWRSWLSQWSGFTGDGFIRFGGPRPAGEGSFRVVYDSRYPIRPEGNLLAAQGERLLEIESEAPDPRFSRRGAFTVRGVGEGPMEITAAFGARLQKVRLEDGSL